MDERQFANIERIPSVTQRERIEQAIPVGDLLLERGNDQFMTVAGSSTDAPVVRRPCIKRRPAPTCSVIDRRIVAGINHADHVEAAGRRALHGMQLFAGQEQHIARADGGLGLLGPDQA